MDGDKVSDWLEGSMDERNVMLIRNNQFGKDGPQAGDRGVSDSTFFIPNMDTVWHRVEFYDYPDEMYSVPEDALQLLT